MCATDSQELQQHFELTTDRYDSAAPASCLKNKSRMQSLATFHSYNFPFKHFLSLVLTHTHTCAQGHQVCMKEWQEPNRVPRAQLLLLLSSQECAVYSWKAETGGWGGLIEKQRNTDTEKEKSGPVYSRMDWSKVKQKKSAKSSSHVRGEKTQVG